MSCRRCPMVGVWYTNTNTNVHILSRVVCGVI
jgi:hypothetical protein